MDFEAREIHVGNAKTEAGVRVVPMFGSARRILLEQKARTRFKRPGDYVFPTVVGTAESPNLWHDREFLYARQKAGLRDTLRLHDLRHFAVRASSRRAQTSWWSPGSRDTRGRT